MPSQYPQKVKAQALTLQRTGENAQATARKLGVPERTVSQWFMRTRQLAAEQGDRELTDQDYAISTKAGELVLDVLDNLAEKDVDDLVKSGFLLNVLRGTSQDKLFKRKELEKPAPDNRQLVIILNSSPAPEQLPGYIPPIEAEAIHEDITEQDPEGTCGS